MREKRTNSIRRTLHVTNTVIVLATLVPLLTSSLYYNLTMIQYKRIIQNVYTANSLASGLQGEIYTAMWNVVSGKTRFEENVQYHLLGQIERSLDELRRNAYNEDNSYLIQVAGNTMETLTGYVDAIGEKHRPRRTCPTE
jgi:hypothetical protein